MIDKYTLEKLFNMRPEWLDDRKDNILDVSYNQGWNACNKVWLSNLAVLREEISEGGSLKEEKLAPFTYDDGYAPDGSEIIDMWECPGCESVFEIESEHYDYCPRCGQHIDWSEIDE